MTAFQRFLIRYSGWALRLLLLAWFVIIVVGAMAGWQIRSSWISLIIATMVVMALISVWGKWMRERYVREGPLPQFIKRKLREQFFQLSSKDAELVERGLRQFFLGCVRSGSKPVAMPSVVVAHAWRVFADHPAVYEEWCNMALGSVLPVAPARALSPHAEHNDALRRTWYWACKEEAIQANAPSRLPILFALDAKFAITDGIVYLANAQEFARRPAAGGGEVHFGTSFSDDQYSGSHSDFGGADSGGDGGGDGGGGGD